MTQRRSGSRVRTFNKPARKRMDNTAVCPSCIVLWYMITSAVAAYYGGEYFQASASLHLHEHLERRASNRQSIHIMTHAQLATSYFVSMPLLPQNPPHHHLTTTKPPISPLLLQFFLLPAPSFSYPLYHQSCFLSVGTFIILHLPHPPPHPYGRYASHSSSRAFSRRPPPPPRPPAAAPSASPCTRQAWPS